MSSSRVRKYVRITAAALSPSSSSSLWVGGGKSTKRERVEGVERRVRRRRYDGDANDSERAVGVSKDEGSGWEEKIGRCRWGGWKPSGV